jgi:hypothetical protein
MTIEVDRCPSCGSIEISLRYISHVAGQLDSAKRTGKCWDCGQEWSSTRSPGRPWSPGATAFEVRNTEVRVPKAEMLI